MLFGDLEVAKQKFEHAQKGLFLHTRALADSFRVGYTEDIRAQGNTIVEATQKLDRAQDVLDVMNITLEHLQKELVLAESAMKNEEQLLQLVISKVGIFPEHVFHKLPSTPFDTPNVLIDVASSSVCPLCARFIIANACMPLSCGCNYHSACWRDIIFRAEHCSQVTCAGCGMPPHGAWMASWEFQLNPAMEAEVDEALHQMDAAHDWVEAPWGQSITATTASWIHHQPRQVPELSTLVEDPPIHDVDVVEKLRRICPELYDVD